MSDNVAVVEAMRLCASLLCARITAKRWRRLPRRRRAPVLTEAGIEPTCAARAGATDMSGRRALCFRNDLSEIAFAGSSAARREGVWTTEARVRFVGQPNRSGFAVHLGRKTVRFAVHLELPQPSGSIQPHQP